MVRSKEEIKRINKIFKLLKKEYPDTKPQLNFSNAFELLIATILSAQCTDARVNIVTKTLFKKYKKPEDFVNSDSKEIEKEIYSTGFYKQKTKSIIACCKKLISDYNSKVPNDFDELIKLPGVGRKTASVVAGNAFNIPAIAVDTHVKRLSNLIGLVNTNDTVKIESQLKDLVEKENWTNLTHWFISHGRKICIARNPKCDLCLINNLCPSSKKNDYGNGKRPRKM